MKSRHSAIGRLIAILHDNSGRDPSESSHTHFVGLSKSKSHNITLYFNR